MRIDHHAAGPVHDAVQLCTRCGATLVDNRGTATSRLDRRSPTFFSVGEPAIVMRESADCMNVTCTHRALARAQQAAT
jgi:hypothetical protein